MADPVSLESRSSSKFTPNISLSLPPDVPYILQEYTATNIPPADLERCLRLIASTSSAAYKASSKGWSPRAKLLEMRDPDMRYLLIRQAGKGQGSESHNPESDDDDGDGEKSLHEKASGFVKAREELPSAEEENVDDDEWEEAIDDNIPGFLSYMHTIDDGVPVIYIYEVHLAESMRNMGVGRRLMEIVESIGHANGDRKAMLTVFLSNEAGIKFYKKLGYSKWDEEYVPAKRRRLRSGVKEMKPTYIIMAKELKQE